jgi:hypothetical protein
MKKLIIILATLWAPLFGQSSLKINKVYIFKDGKVFLQATTQGSTINKTIVLDGFAMPNIIFGSLKVKAPASLAMVSKNSDTMEFKTPAISTFAILQANKGKTVHITTDKEEIVGIVHQVNELSNNTQPNSNGQLAVIKSSNKNYVFTAQNIDGIKTLWFEDDLSTMIKQVAYKESLILKFEKDFGNGTVNIDYLSNQNPWIPSYTLNLNKTTFNLELFAELNSGNMKWDNTEVFLVDGYSNFSISGSSQLSNDYTSANNPYYPRYENQSEKSYRNEYYDYSDDVQISNEEQGNMHIYSLGRLSIPIGDATLIKVLSTAGKSKQYFKGILPQEQYNYDDYTESDNRNITVNEVIELTNEGKEPLMTGAVLITSDKNDLPLAHTDMPSILSDATGTIILGQSAQINLYQKETLESTVEEAKIFVIIKNELNHSLITKTVVVKIENNKPTEINLHLTRSISGTLEKASIKPTKQDEKPQANSPNNILDLTWELTLKPGEKKEITFTYQYYEYSGY